MYKYTTKNYACMISTQAPNLQFDLCNQDTVHEQERQNILLKDWQCTTSCCLITNLIIHNLGTILKHPKKFSFILQGLFIGKNTGKVYICAQADDFSQQKVVCIGDNLHNFIWVGPTPPVEYHSGSCILDGCYGCFDPVIRDRLLHFKH